MTLSSSDAPFEAEISAFERADRERPPEKGGVVFVGSSSIRLWSTLAQDFPDDHVLNRGFGGSEIVDSIRYVDRIAFPHEPRLIVLYAGTNDIALGKSPEQVATDFSAFVARVRERSNVRIAYISNAPQPARHALWGKVKAANALIKARCRGDATLIYIDIFSQMIGPNGEPRPEFFVEDQIHMNSSGYAIWRDVVAPYLVSGHSVLD